MLRITAPTLFVLASPVLAGNAVLVVDSSGGGDFMTIGSALAAAVDGDTLLVRPGTYDEDVVVDDLDVLILADGGLVTVDTLEVRNVSSGKSVAVRGLTLDADALPPAHTLRLADCAGSIWIEDTIVDPGSPFTGPEFRVEDCTTVKLVRIQSVGRFNTVQIVRSDVLLMDSLVTGGLGFSPGCPFGNGAGTDGIRVEDGSLSLTGSTVQGGDGGWGLFCGDFGCTPGMTGGDGIVLAGNGSTQVFELDSTVQGGAGGAGVPFNGICSSADGAPGVAYVIEAGTVIPEAGDAAALGFTSPVRSGQPVDWDLLGPAGAFAWLVAAGQSGPGLRLPIFEGVLALFPRWIVAPLGIIPAGGHIDDASHPLTLNLAPGVLVQELYLQGFSFLPPVGLVAGSSSWLVVIDPAF